MCKIAHRGACMAIFKGMGLSIFLKNMITRESLGRQKAVAQAGNMAKET